MSFGADDECDSGFIVIPADLSSCGSDTGQFLPAHQLSSREPSRFQLNLLDDLAVLPLADSISEHENLFRPFFGVLHESLEVSLDHTSHIANDFSVDQSSS